VGAVRLALQFNSGLAFSLFTGRATLVTVLLGVGVVVLAVLVARVRTVARPSAGDWCSGEGSGT
jgi:lipoprotein signal peptidase